jgi:hypothetical protein
MGDIVMAFFELFLNKHIFLGATVLVAVVAGVLLGTAIESAIADLSPWILAGLAFLIIGLAPIVATTELLLWPAWAVIFLGVALLAIGYVIGG